MHEKPASPWDRARHHETWRHKVAFCIRLFIPLWAFGALCAFGYQAHRANWDSEPVGKLGVLSAIILIPVLLFSFYLRNALRDARRAGMPLSRWFWEKDLRRHLGVVRPPSPVAKKVDSWLIITMPPVFVFAFVLVAILKPRAAAPALIFATFFAALYSLQLLKARKRSKTQGIKLLDALVVSFYVEESKTNLAINKSPETLETEKLPLPRNRTLALASLCAFTIISGILMVALLPGHGVLFPLGDHKVVAAPVSVLLIFFGIAGLVRLLEFGEWRRSTEKPQKRKEPIPAS